ncbi:hypothetical protein HOE04_03650 [archaeon]|jgi:hypothetical protein|nr:hypothetical protein [archaeon]
MIKNSYEEFDRDFVGKYTKPRSFSVGGIEGVVVDPHNEVFEFWYNAIKSNGEDSPAVLLHIDNHSDLSGGKRIREDCRSVRDYSRRDLDIASFIAPAVYYGLVDKIYWFDPRNINMKVYGRNGKDNMFVDVDSNGEIIWQKWGRNIYAPMDEDVLNHNVLKKDLKNFQGRIILDVDLDAFECIDDAEYNWKFGNYRLLDGKGNERLNKTLNLLRRLPRPSLISVARSQTPFAYTPTDRVDGIEKKLMKVLKKVYS